MRRRLRLRPDRAPLRRAPSLLPQLVAQGRRATCRHGPDDGQVRRRPRRTEATKAAERLQDQAGGVLDFLGDSVTLPLRRRRGPTPARARGAPRPGPRRTSVERRSAADRPRADLGHPRLRRALGVAGRQPPRRAVARRARGRAALRGRPPRPQDDPVEGRPAAGQLMGAAPEEGCRPAIEADLPRLAELVGRGRRRSCGPAGAVRCGPARRPPPAVRGGAASRARRRRPPRAGGHRRRHRHGLRRRPGRACWRTAACLGVVTDLYTEPGAASSASAR